MFTIHFSHSCRSDIPYIRRFCQLSTPPHSYPPTVTINISCAIGICKVGAKIATSTALGSAPTPLKAVNNSLTPLNLPLHFQLPPTNLSFFFCVCVFFCSFLIGGGWSYFVGSCGCFGCRRIKMKLRIFLLRYNFHGKTSVIRAIPFSQLSCG